MLSTSDNGPAAASYDSFRLEYLFAIKKDGLIIPGKFGETRRLNHVNLILFPQWTRVQTTLARMEEHVQLLEKTVTVVSVARDIMVTVVKKVHIHT